MLHNQWNTIESRIYLPDIYIYISIIPSNIFIIYDDNFINIYFVFFLSKWKIKKKKAVTLDNVSVSMAETVRGRIDEALRLVRMSPTPLAPKNQERNRTYNCSLTKKTPAIKTHIEWSHPWDCLFLFSWDSSQNKCWIQLQSGNYCTKEFRASCA